MSICLKDYLDAAERVQDRSPLEGEMDYESELLQEEVEAGLSEGITDEEEAAYYQVGQRKLYLELKKVEDMEVVGSLEYLLPVFDSFRI
ncbi:hypothetical protein R6Q59_010707 [Mikania micrantha]